jgi:23S rRNA (guanine745-N1)-methyltransferase
MKLICPVCGKPLEKINKEACCENNHHFDYAKSGYLNLLVSNKKIHGDDAGMVKARTLFLNSEAYGFLRDRIAELCKGSEVLADLGCGEGYYTSAFNAKEKYGFDLSKEALKHAAKHDKSTQYTIASIFHLPLPDACADTCVTCFAPLAKDEIIRILKPHGKFIFVSPGAKHLFEMKEVLYEHPYENETDDPDAGMNLIHKEEIENRFLCTQEEIAALFTMTPYVWRTSKEDQKRLKEKEQLEITAQFIIRVYEKC